MAKGFQDDKLKALKDMSKETDDSNRKISTVIYFCIVAIILFIIYLLIAGSV